MNPADLPPVSAAAIIVQADALLWGAVSFGSIGDEFSAPKVREAFALIRLLKRQLPPEQQVMT